MLFLLMTMRCFVSTEDQNTAIFSLLAVSTGLLAYSLVRQMVPGSRHRISPGAIGRTGRKLVAIPAAIRRRVADDGGFRGAGRAHEVS